MKERHQQGTTSDLDRLRKVVVVPYDPDWPRLYRQQEARVRGALGAAALAIAHVGSTSVPGLAAKPVIDIHLTVRDSGREADYAPRLEDAGYRLVVREPGWFEHRMFKGCDPEVNLHVFSEACPELDRCRLFRDWLRISSSDRMLYTEAKRALAQRDWVRVQDYADAKTDIVSEIMNRAEAWEREGRPALCAS